MPCDEKKGNKMMLVYHIETCTCYLFVIYLMLPWLGLQAGFKLKLSQLPAEASHSCSFSLGNFSSRQAGAQAKHEKQQLSEVPSFIHLQHTNATPAPLSTSAHTAIPLLS